MRLQEDWRQLNTDWNLVRDNEGDKRNESRVNLRKGGRHFLKNEAELNSSGM